MEEGRSSDDADDDPYNIQWQNYTPSERIHILRVLQRDVQLKWADYNRIRYASFSFLFLMTRSSDVCVCVRGGGRNWVITFLAHYILSSFSTSSSAVCTSRKENCEFKLNNRSEG